MQALEDQVQALQDRLKELEIERAHNTAQLDALSQCVRGMELAPRPDAGPDSSQEARAPSRHTMSNMRRLRRLERLQLRCPGLLQSC